MTTLENPDRVDPVLEKATDGLSAAEAAAQMGVTRQTILNWIRAGDLPATRFGVRKGHYRIDPQDLEKLRTQV